MCDLAYRPHNIHYLVIRPKTPKVSCEWLIIFLLQLINILPLDLKNIIDLIKPKVLKGN